MVSVSDMLNFGVSSLCTMPRRRMRVTAPKRFLQCEICQGSTAPKGRCPPGVLAPHPERLQEGLVLLDSHLIIIVLCITSIFFQ